jgi:tRNA (guanine-N7-)-methyltransferase
MKEESSKYRHIKSYVIRQSRISSLQKRSLEELSDKHCIPYQSSPYDFNRTFDTSRPLVMEIGFGMGSAAINIAEKMRTWNFIGVEVHPPGVGKLLSEIEKNDLDNIKIVQHDAVDVVKKMAVPGTFQGFHIFFPDPWPKKKHHKRRLLNRSFVFSLTNALSDSGYIYIVTDWDDYAEQIKKVLNEQNSLSKSPHIPEWRPITEFERKGLEQNHRVHEFYYVKTDNH